MNRFLSLFVLSLSQLVFFAQAGWAADVPIPLQQVQEEETKCVLTLNTVPANAGSFNRSSGGTFSAGQSVYMYYYANTDYVFEYWQSGDSIVSRDRYFYFTMPDHDATLTAVFRFDPGNPGDPDAPDQTKKYTLTLNTVPANAGSFNRNSGEQFTAGQSVYMYYYANTDYVFDSWQSGDSVVSRDRYFYFTMPEHDAELTAVYKYSPGSPADPDTAQVYYTVTLKTQPANAGSFNWNDNTQRVAGSSGYIYAYANTDYVFREWQLDGQQVSISQRYDFTMPAKNMTLVALYDYNPGNPGNPGKNYWNEETGEVIVDDFSAGSLSSAVSNTIGGSSNCDKVQMITVAGTVSQSDWGVVNNYKNCTLLDMSRTYGMTYVPSYNFSGNSVLTTMVLPASIEKIDYYAFRNCSSLSSISIYAATPPTIGTRAFEGIADSIVYVPADAIALYQEADGWKDFTILPLAKEVSALEVNLPEETDVNLYKDMFIELINAKSGQKQRYVVTNRLTYTFNSLIHRTSYNIYLKNKQGDVLGEVDGIDIIDQDVSVTFPSLMVPRDLTLRVLTPSGEDVTSQTTITWFDQKDTYLTKGNTLTGQLEGVNVKYRVQLPQTLGMLYQLPADVIYEVQATNSISLTLTDIPQTTISGVVHDVKTGQALSGATVAVSQMLNGLYSKSFTTKTDNQGRWSLQVYEAKTDITASMDDYVSKTQSFEAQAIVGGDLQSPTEIPTFELKDINGTTISLNLTYTGTNGETQEFYSDYANVAYTVYNETLQQPVTDANVQYPQIVLMEQLPAGTVLRLTATSKNQKFMPVTATATVDSLDRASVTLPIKQLGGITASFRQTDNPSVTAILYNANGQLLKKYDYASASLTISELQDGQYTLVSMANSQFFNSIGSVSQFAEAGLREGIDYVKNAVTVKSGEMTVVENQLIPFLDESKLYYTGDGTSITVNKSQITTGNYLTITGKIDFKQAYANSVSDVKLIVNLPEESSFVENSVMRGSITASYTYADNQVVVPLDYYGERVRFCFIPTAGGNFAATAQVQFTLNGKTVTQPIGNANFTVKNLSISVPSTVAKTTVPINGTSPGKSMIEIYDNGMLVGQTVSLANGTWATSIELTNCYNLSMHEIYAKIKSTMGISMQTETQCIKYDANAIQLANVTMLHNNPEMRKVYEVNFDFLNPGTTAPTYIYYIYNKEFTFTIDFTNNDTTKVKNVKLFVLTGKNNIVCLEPIYDKKLSKWVVSSEFGNMYDGDIPVNVAVDYDIISSEEIDNTQSDELQMNNLDKIDDVICNTVEEKLEADVVIDGDDLIRGKLWINPAEVENYICDIKTFDYEKKDSLTSLYSFTYNNLDTLKAYVFDELMLGLYHLVVIDETEKLIFEINVEYNESDSVYHRRMSKILTKTEWSILLNNLKKFDGKALSDIGGDILDAFDLTKYCEVPAFKCWIDLIESFIDSDIRWRTAAMNALNKRCKDTLMLSTEQIKALHKELVDIENDANAFHEAYFNYLHEYKTRVVKSLAFDVGVNLAGGFIGKLAGRGGKSYRFLKNSKNTKFKQFYFRIGKNYRTQKLNRERLSNAFDFIAGNTFEELTDHLLNPEWADFSNISSTKFGQWAPQLQASLTRRYADLIAKAKIMYKKCKEEKDSIPNHPPFTQTPAIPQIDPSGYVYEGVASNRVQGATATVYYKETIEDMYGDLHENIVLWDAEEYAQENPLFTDENGMYRWDVPQGLWQVKFEKEGYQTTYSEWLPVPPPQLEVNIPMTQLLQPSVATAKAYDEGVEVTFDKYMNPESLTTDNIFLTRNGEVTEGTIELLNEEVAYEGQSQTYASKVRFTVPEGENLLSTDEVQLTVRKTVESYAGVQMQDDYVQTFDVEPRVRLMAIDSLVNIGYGNERTLTVAALPADASKGKKVTVKSLSTMIASIDKEELTLDENGQAELKVTGELPGSTVLSYQVEGTDVEGITTVNVKDAALLVTVTPRASRVSGTEVYRGTAIRLTSETENAVIYYTLDGSCPCNTETAIKYNADEPIIIAGDSVTIKAMAQGHDLAESDVAEFSYTLKKTTLGYQLPTGWTWISHNVESPVAAQAFQEGAERIVSQTQEVFNDPQAGFIGNLQELQPATAYKVKQKTQNSVRLTGFEWNTVRNNVSVGTGWNWIGYPLNQTMTLQEALAYFTPNDGDYIVGQNGYSEYSDGAWHGTLEGMIPGEGYMYKSISQNEISFNTTIVSTAASRLKKRTMLKNSPWAADSYAYPNVMPLTAHLYASGVQSENDDFVVAAFAGSECRGVGQWKESRLLMSIGGEGGEQLHFMAYDPQTEEVYSVAETMTFEADNVGTWRMPFTLTIGNEATDISMLYQDVSVSPHVAHDYIHVAAGGRQISRISLTDMSGRTVLNLSADHQEATVNIQTLPDGIYIVTVVADGRSNYQKIVKTSI